MTSPSSGVSSSPAGRLSAAGASLRSLSPSKCLSALADTESLNSRKPPPSCRPSWGSRLPPTITRTITRMMASSSGPRPAMNSFVMAVCAPTEEYAQRSGCEFVRYATTRAQVRRAGTDVGRRPHQAPFGTPMSQPDNTNYVRRVVLPSGRAIEVVYFENQPAHTAPTSAAAPAHADLHVCPDCDR